MRNKLSVGFACLLFFIAVSPSFAETSTSSSELKTTYASDSSRLKNIQERRETVKENIEKRKEAVQEKVKAAREQFKLRLSLLKDTRKKDLVATMDARLNNINTNRTVHFGKVLARLSELLTKIKDKTTTAKSESLNTASVEAAIQNAETAIGTAEDAVASQAAEMYTAAIVDETTLRQTMGAAVTQLKTDLMSTYQLVSTAKIAVAKAVNEVAKLRGSKETQ